MKIFGKDGNEYASVKECLRADEAYEKRIAEAKEREEAQKREQELKLAEKKAEISKRKKELSAAIDAANTEVAEARIAYNRDKERAERLIAEARKEAEVILTEANKKLKLATEKKMNAISTFNHEFGPFTTVLTGQDAWDEYKRISNSIDETFNIFKNLFNF